MLYFSAVTRKRQRPQVAHPPSANPPLQKHPPNQMIRNPRSLNNLARRIKSRLHPATRNQRVAQPNNQQRYNRYFWLRFGMTKLNFRVVCREIFQISKNFVFFLRTSSGYLTRYGLGSVFKIRFQGFVEIMDPCLFFFEY